MILERELVGVSIYLGTIPNWQRSVIINNSQILDKLYLITDDEEFSPEIDNLIILSTDKYIEYVNNNIGPRNWTPNVDSDIVAYTGLEILEYYGYSYDRLLYLDTDYFLYNKWILKELFSSCNETICMKDENLYIKYDNEYLYNAGCIFLVKGNYLQNEFYKDLLNVIDSVEYSYTATGPGITNRQIYREIMDKNVYSKIEPYSLDPHTMFTGPNMYPFKQRSLGLHITNSVAKEINYQVVGVTCHQGLIDILIIHNEGSNE